MNLTATCERDRCRSVVPSVERLVSCVKPEDGRLLATELARYPDIVTVDWCNDYRKLPVFWRLSSLLNALSDRRWITIWTVLRETLKARWDLPYLTFLVKYALRIILKRTIYFFLSSFSYNSINLMRDDKLLPFYSHSPTRINDYPS